MITSRSYSKRCQLKYWLCRNEVIGNCQYCGRSFCAEHGTVYPDHQQVCQRKQCRTKYEDVVVHQQYKASVQERNAVKLCGVAECQGTLSGACSRCEGIFCELHVKPRQWETKMQNRREVSVFLSLCDHCWQRRGIWRRR